LLTNQGHGRLNTTRCNPGFHFRFFAEKKQSLRSHPLRGGEHLSFDYTVGGSGVGFAKTKSRSQITHPLVVYCRFIYALAPLHGGDGRFEAEVKCVYRSEEMVVDEGGIAAKTRQSVLHCFAMADAKTNRPGSFLSSFFTE
jgi:hypothetical protein